MPKDSDNLLSDKSLLNILFQKLQTFNYPIWDKENIEENCKTLIITCNYLVSLLTPLLGPKRLLELYSGTIEHRKHKNNIVSKMLKWLTSFPGFFENKKHKDHVRISILGKSGRLLESISIYEKVISSGETLGCAVASFLESKFSRDFSSLNGDDACRLVVGLAAFMRSIPPFSRVSSRGRGDNTFFAIITEEQPQEIKNETSVIATTAGITSTSLDYWQKWANGNTTAQYNGNTTAQYIGEIDPDLDRIILNDVRRGVEPI